MFRFDSDCYLGCEFQWLLPMCLSICVLKPTVSPLLFNGPEGQDVQRDTAKCSFFLDREKKFGCVPQCRDWDANMESFVMCVRLSVASH